MKYIAFAGGGEAVTQLLAGSLQAFTGDLSEAQGFVESGDIKVVAVLAPERLDGEFAEIPTAREQGIDAVGANWRGFYAPGGMSDEAYDYWVEQIDTLYDSRRVEGGDGGQRPGAARPAGRGVPGASWPSRCRTSQDLSREIGILQ